MRMLAHVKRLVPWLRDQVDGKIVYSAPLGVLANTFYCIRHYVFDMQGVYANVQTAEQLQQRMGKTQQVSVLFKTLFNCNVPDTVVNSRQVICVPWTIMD